MKIDNQVANELLIAFRRGERTQEFMDAISGVRGYQLKNSTNQGCIRGMFAKEIIKDQFLIELDDIIMVFWQGVFENVDKAKLWGESVKIRSLNNDSEERSTKNNPIHYLRRQGGFSVRNFITSLYRKSLQQSCTICGNTASVTNNKICKRRTNEGICGGEMITTHKFLEIHDDTDDLYQDMSIYKLENEDMEVRIKYILNSFANQVLGKGNRSYQVFKILTDPSASLEMCAACNLCDAKSFNIDRCTNYNANIGYYLGVNKTMIANKMRRIRKTLPEFLFSEGTNDANYILDLIPRKYVGLSHIID